MWVCYWGGDDSGLVVMMVGWLDGFVLMVHMSAGESYEICSCSG